MCTSFHLTLKEEISSIREMLAQILGAPRRNEQQSGENGGVQMEPENGCNSSPDTPGNPPTRDYPKTVTAVRKERG